MSLNIRKAAKWAIRLLGDVFNVLRIKDHRIYLSCFDGSKYGFDQRAFAEYIDETYPNQFEFVWEYERDPPKSEYMPECMSIVKAKTVKQLMAIKTSRYIVCNINPHDYIGYRNQQVIVNTMHGFGIKGVEGLYDRGTIDRFCKADLFCSYSEWFTTWFIRGICSYEGQVVKSGASKNDIFFDAIRSSEAKLKARLILDISSDAKVLLYAPTFRGNFDFYDYSIDFAKVISEFEKKFGGKWKCLVRYHPLIKSYERLDNNVVAVIDATGYDDMQELLCLADVLLSDYSGCIWDFAQSKKPIFLYIPDVQEYIAERGFSVPLKNLPYPYALTEYELIQHIREFDQDDYKARIDRFFDYLVSYEDGNASKRIFESMTAFTKS